MSQCRRPRRLIYALISLLYAQQARASEPPSDPLLAYTFEDDIVGGDTHRPDEILIPVQPHPARESLIRVREHFIRELCQSIEDL